MKLQGSCAVFLQSIIVFLSIGSLQCLQANPLKNQTDHEALLKFKEGITNAPFHVLMSSWNGSIPFCNWYGVTCSRRHHQRVTSLALRSQGLAGSISPYIGNLSFLRVIDLRNNSLHGEIPREVGKLFRLQHFSLTNNTLAGEIPINLTMCSRLKTIHLLGNNIAGKIPQELGSLQGLQALSLGRNNLTEEIPASLGNVSSLYFISLIENNLGGKIPYSLCQLRSLSFFGVGGNNLSGTVPQCLFNISSISRIVATNNQLSGSLPENIGFTLPNLKLLYIGENWFSGSIPTSFSNASQLEQLHIPDNNFVGQVPRNLGNLQNLWNLNLGFNYLGSGGDKDLLFLPSLKNCSNLQLLDFSGNNFGGVLSNSLFNLSIQLRGLSLGRNQISGIIPAALESLVNLEVLGMESNLFTGAIPSYFGKFHMLQVLSLKENRLSGEIPNSIGNISRLIRLYLFDNNLGGSIPASLGNCQDLYLLDVSRNNFSGDIPQEVMSLSSLSVVLNLSHNSLVGKLPTEVGKLKQVTIMDISENYISGEIPLTIADCLSLEFLYMQGNSLQGPVPPSLVSLKGLQQLDISRNNLTGKIPEGLQNISFLSYLNLSFNDLEGEVPVAGVFRSARTVSLVGNSKLCGGISELRLPKCPTRALKEGNSRPFRLTVIIVCTFLGVILISAFGVLYCRRKLKKKPAPATATMDHLMKVSYKELCQATGEFSPNNLIGSGSFGSVYKGLLGPEERPVAVKVLNLQRKGAFKSFMAECKALRNIRHRNLVKIITSCASLDYKGKEFTALVFEFMSNGSLEQWLYPDIEGENQSRILNLLQRLNVTIDVASAVHYLHDLSETPVIHCDLKPSNVLLDDDLVAHVGDFGLARLAASGDPSQSKSSSSIGIKGTVGYAPPEYGMGSVPSKEGDVYSFGILVLELFIGRRPTNEIFNDTQNLHHFVKAALPERLLEVVDPMLLTRESAEREATRASTYTELNNNGVVEERDNEYNLGMMGANEAKCLLSVLEDGVTCSKELPRERMGMGEAIRELHKIKNAFQNHHGQIRGGRQTRVN